MADSHFIPLANHILHSIQKDLLILKEHQVLDDKTYQDIITLLPAQAKPLFNEMNTINTINNNNNNNNNAIRPPLPTRKSTSTSPRITPTPAPRTPSFPKLPSRRSESQAFEPIIENIPTIKKIETNTTTPPPPPSYNASVKTQMVEAVYDYNGDPSTDLSFHKGDIFEVTEHVNDDWWRGTLNGKSGIFPQNHVQVISSTQKHPQILPTTHTYSTTTVQQQPYITQSTIHQPYNYPPPPTMMYHAPPPPQQMGSSSSPAFVKNEGSAADEHGDGNKVQNMAKKFGGKVGEAAVFGFGATVGSKVANSIF